MAAQMMKKFSGYGRHCFCDAAIMPPLPLFSKRSERSRWLHGFTHSSLARGGKGGGTERGREAEEWLPSRSRRVGLP